MFGFHWKNPSVISQWYIKNECSDMACFGSSLFQLHNVCLGYSGCASHFLFYARLVTFKSAKKWYLMRMSISWVCPFKRLLKCVDAMKAPQRLVALNALGCSLIWCRWQTKQRGQFAIISPFIRKSQICCILRSDILKTRFCFIVLAVHLVKKVKPQNEWWNVELCLRERDLDCVVNKHTALRV